ncbi:hypothetical protein [Photobacterium sp. GSS17]|uniref:hypothetical protein n=1 Tax=Photobacterium sp. GSS17 TaxID=3020715 RepID=UPI00235FC8CA|nr:hypothetical protein [Photobacterium sp. GSS17]
MKAGDILASRSDSLGSRIICMLTRSDWSHVAIATSHNTVLEATKSTATTSDEVREISLAEFIDANDQVILLEKPGSLSLMQSKQLESFVQSLKSKRYTVVHAGFTIFPGFIWTLATLLILASSIELFSINRELGASLKSYFIALAMTIIFICLWAVANIWANRTKLGVAMTEKIYCKTRFGRYLVNKKHDMFCSRLVLLVDRDLAGGLSPKVPDENEVQPKHIVNACRAMGWTCRKLSNPNEPS